MNKKFNFKLISQDKKARLGKITTGSRDNSNSNIHACWYRSHS